jgi:hypothetical protein
MTGCHEKNSVEQRSVIHPRQERKRKGHERTLRIGIEDFTDDKSRKSAISVLKIANLVRKANQFAEQDGYMLNETCLQSSSV